MLTHSAHVCFKFYHVCLHAAACISAFLWAWAAADYTDAVVGRALGKLAGSNSVHTGNACLSLFPVCMMLHVSAGCRTVVLVFTIICALCLSNCLRHSACMPAFFLQAWAAAEYLDMVVGRVLSRLASSKLASNTYVMLSSDNGPQLLPGEETPAAKLVSSKASRVVVICALLHAAALVADIALLMCLELPCSCACPVVCRAVKLWY
jgi:hypothetical protein